jgi:hypothetical protein
MNGTWMARALAAAESQEQADFFNEFCSSLMGICKGREGSQIWYIAEKLDKSAADVLEELVKTRVYHAEEYRKDTLRRDELRKDIYALEAKLRELREPEAACAKESSC